MYNPAGSEACFLEQITPVVLPIGYRPHRTPRRKAA